MGRFCTVYVYAKMDSNNSDSSKDIDTKLRTVFNCEQQNVYETNTHNSKNVRMYYLTKCYQ